MAHQEPSWWYAGGATWQRTCLLPFASLYGRIAQSRFAATRPYRAGLPVICVGNFTAGGTGKTPMSLLVADIVQQAGGEPWFLSRGYGGRLDGQERVDPLRHTAAEVGDEPLLLAARAPTVISRDRRLGAEFIVRRAPTNAVIIMDDGLQNPALAKDLTIALIDAHRGLGNGAVMPAGPLRATLGFQLAQTDIIVINGAGGGTAGEQLSSAANAAEIPRLTAAATPRGDVAWLRGARVIAFAGIANPERFFKLLEQLGATIVERATFADHQTLPNADATDLLACSAKLDAELVTTEKDFVRLSGLDGDRVTLQAVAKQVPISLHMPDADHALLAGKIAALINAKR